MSEPDADRPWWLYLLACQDGRTYAGIALDVEARFALHVAGKGARFTRSNKPVKILGVESFTTKSAALKAEIALKRLTREQRLEWARASTIPSAPSPASSYSLPRLRGRVREGAKLAED